MERFVGGHILSVHFPFSDLSSTKKRPALVITSLRKSADIILCMITSTFRDDGYSIPLNSSDFQVGSLPVRISFIRPCHLFTADGNSQLIISSKGKLKAQKLQEVINKLVGIISV